MNAASDATAAQVETIEARMDGRVSSMEATFAAFSRLMDERQKNSDARMDRMEGMMAEIRASIASLRVTIIITAITSVLAVAALNAAVMSNMLAAFESGKNTSAAQAEVKRQTEETAALLRRIQQNLDQQQSTRDNNNRK